VATVIGISLCVIAHETMSAAQKNGGNAAVGTRVYLKGNKKFYALEDLRALAEQAINRKVTNMVWTDVQAVNASVDVSSTNLVKFFFSCGLGHRSFLISFDRDGMPSQVAEGTETD